MPLYEFDCAENHRFEREMPFLASEERVACEVPVRVTADDGSFTHRFCGASAKKLLNPVSPVAQGG